MKILKRILALLLYVVILPCYVTSILFFALTSIIIFPFGELFYFLRDGKFKIAVDCVDDINNYITYYPNILANHIDNYMENLSK